MRLLGSVNRFCLSFCSLAVLLTNAGCASKWVREVPPELLASKEVLAAPASALIKQGSRPVIVVRWPALIDSAAKPLIVDNVYAYMQRVTGWNMHGVEDFSGVPELLQASSTFYAGELYWSIRRAFPQAAVLMEPLMVRVGPGGRLEDLPIVDASVPATVVADLTVFGYPRLALIHNDFVFNLRTAPAASPVNCGLLLASAENLPNAGGLQEDACQSNLARGAPMTRWYLDPDAATNQWTRPQRKRLPLSGDYTVVHTLLGESNADAVSATPSDYVKRSRPGSPAEADRAVYHPFIDNFARIAASGLNVTLVEAGRPQLLADYAKSFDPGLEVALASGRTLSPAEEANVALLRRLLDQEVKVRATRDEQLARELLGGPFGQSYRQARDGMYAGYGKQMLSMWATTVAAIGAHGAMMSGATSVTAQIAASNATVDRFDRETQAQGQAYYKSVAPSMQSMGKATLSFAQQSASVEVADQLALRRSLKTLYDRHKQP